ncbi:MAG: hypothetical protein EP344_11335 [Bacteroidetes bacterium]|nr:MAG: hypothetical protein EP344_11335 [Bacteroidota bacterium]
MSDTANCNQNTNPLRLVREGTSQDQRLFQALDPAYIPVNERTPAHGMVFAKAIAEWLKYYDPGNNLSGNWEQFFQEDVSVTLALASVQDVDGYREAINSYFIFLNDLTNDSDLPGLRQHLGYLYSCVGSLALQLDLFLARLPRELELYGALQNLIQTQLAGSFQRLIAYYKGGGAAHIEDVAPDIRIMGAGVIPFANVLTTGLSTDWFVHSGAPDWTAYTTGILADSSIYGAAAGDFASINHAATHNLFTGIFDQFLKVYARVIRDARQALDATLTNWDTHAPHYALFLAFLRLFEYGRTEMNTLTKRHLDFYYKNILRIKEKPAEPGQAHLLLELAKQVPDFELTAGTTFKAGKDDLGKEAFFAADRDFVANQATVENLKSVYRHKNLPGDTLPGQNNRFFAAPVANSEDGNGGELLSADKSWHPFYHKKYDNGVLEEILTPRAEIGFALASHYLWLAEGTRTITLEFSFVSNPPAFANHISCRLSGPKGWIEATPVALSGGKQGFKVTLSGNDPAVVPYDVKTHGYSFQTDLPVLLVTLRQDDTNQNYFYSHLQDTAVTSIDLTVKVEGLKTLAVSNDFGPVDLSKPFQPFGAQPVNGSSLTIGSKELFQKIPTEVSMNLQWQNTPDPHGTANPQIKRYYLDDGEWKSYGGNYSIGSTSFNLNYAVSNSQIEGPDFSEAELFQSSSRQGFLRLQLTSDFGQKQFQDDLVAYLIAGDTTNPPPQPPVGPAAARLSVDYTAVQTITLNSASQGAYDNRTARYIHVYPFGQAEQHPAILTAGSKVYLLPQFEFLVDGEKKESEGELYIGIARLAPPQNLSLLFQVADGTADPLSIKPPQHLHWSYLRNNEWIDFQPNEVEDQTKGLTHSGLVVLSVPRDATDRNTLLPTGLHWLRVAVETETDAVCRAIGVAAQAFLSTFADRNNDPAFAANVLPAGTIKKLERPDADVKKVGQPFASFGGRGQERPGSYYTRVSERLRHKDRAITLWDYERLVLETFPGIYKVKCLNHTQYEPSTSGAGIYRELAPGHVTVVTVPNQQFHNLRDPLRPYTSLGLLLDIEDFLKKRLSCFVRLHVRNPQFEEVRLRCRVRFFPGFDETFYLKKLRQAVTRFLSPWAYPDGGSPTFGGKVYKSVLINFMEEQPYVDYLTDVALFHDINGVPGATDMNEVEASIAVAILVSVPEDAHDISIIDPAEEETLREKCACGS